jgi:hypothetical protein
MMDQGRLLFAMRAVLVAAEAKLAASQPRYDNDRAQVKYQADLVAAKQREVALQAKLAIDHERNGALRAGRAGRCTVYIRACTEVWGYTYTTQEMELYQETQAQKQQQSFGVVISSRDTANLHKGHFGFVSLRSGRGFVAVYRRRCSGGGA